MTDLDDLYNLFLARAGLKSELAKMEEQARGYRVNVERCERASSDFRQKISDLEEKIRKVMR